jgi:hypothetical protein
VNWQSEHERIMAEMCNLFGLPPNSPNDVLMAAYSKADKLARADFDRLNRLNDEAVAKAEKQL